MASTSDHESEPTRSAQRAKNSCSRPSHSPHKLPYAARSTLLSIDAPLITSSSEAQVLSLSTCFSRSSFGHNSSTHQHARSRSTVCSSGSSESIQNACPTLPLTCLQNHVTHVD